MLALKIKKKKKGFVSHNTKSIFKSKKRQLINYLYKQVIISSIEEVIKAVQCWWQRVEVH